MRYFRDVDSAQHWMNNAVREEMIVPAMASSVVAEITAQAENMAHLENTISEKSEEIAALEVEVEGLGDQIGKLDEKIQRMTEIIDKLGIKTKVLDMLKREF